jgi:hypothetical protein
LAALTTSLQTIGLAGSLFQIFKYLAPAYTYRNAMLKAGTWSGRKSQQQAKLASKLGTKEGSRNGDEMVAGSGTADV